MMDFTISIAISLVILAAVWPYVARIRHPEQKPLAAYLIFLTLFVTVTVVLFGMLTMFAGELGLARALENPVAAFVLLALVFLPALALATWQARKPPWRRGPPN